jgi:hypothetical protein
MRVSPAVGITRNAMSRPVALCAAFAVTLLAGAGPAAAASAPTATTGPVSAVGPSSATVSGSVNPNGAATSWYVEYGTSTSYGAKTSAASAGSGTVGVPVSATLASLKPGTSYHYRIVATSSAGTGRGADGLLTTASAPVAVTGSASSVTATSATLNGTVKPGSRATTWYAEYGTSTSYGTKTSAKDAGAGTTAVDVSAAVSGLQTGRTYHFRIVAMSDAGTSRGADRMFLTTAAPTVTTKAASSVQDTSAKLNGSVNPNGQATNAYFEYGTSTGYGSKTAAKSMGSGTGSTGIAISVGGLAASTTYHARLVAANGSGTSSGVDVTFTTNGPPILRTGPAAGVGSTAATLTGSVDPSGHSTSWYFQYGATAGYGGKTRAQSGGSSPGARPVSAPIGALTPGATYHFRLVATNGSGTGYGADMLFTTVGPAATLATSSEAVVFRHGVTLSGTVSSKRENERVAVFAQRLGSGSFTSVTTVLTGPGGAWTLTVRPAIRTTYKTIWNTFMTATVTVGVRPGVSLRIRPKQRFTTHVAAARSFAGRVVQLQRRRLDGTWRTLARARLGSRSTATFHASLPRGHSTLRAAISVNQVSAGYLAGFSSWRFIRRR